MNLYAAAARRRLGELLGGAAGRALIEDADRFFAGQNVKNPSRMVALIVPAFGRD